MAKLPKKLKCSHCEEKSAEFSHKTEDISAAHYICMNTQCESYGHEVRLYSYAVLKGKSEDKYEVTIKGEKEEIKCTVCRNDKFYNVFYCNKAMLICNKCREIVGSYGFELSKKEK